MSDRIKVSPLSKHLAVSIYYFQPQYSKHLLSISEKNNCNLPIFTFSKFRICKLVKSKRIFKVCDLKMSLSIAPGAIVCNESVLIGDISIGSRTVVHPKVLI